MESIAMRKTVNIAHIVERANTYFQVSKPDQREARRMLQSFVESILHEAKAYHGFRYLTPDDMPEREYGTFCLECWDNGLAYALTHKPSNRSVYVQGDDALQFERDREAAEIAFPDKTDDEIMAWLWDQCDYGSASEANEESP
jgi:hypothetical protein